MNIRILHFAGCPHVSDTLAVLREILRQEALPAVVETVELTDSQQARQQRFLGSPTVQIDGLDIELDRRGDMPCFGCRLYRTGRGQRGVPPAEMIRQAIRRARGPRLKVLFLCTGNSCRSQMAEAWARVLVGDFIQPYSAGIEPRGLDPRAVRVMDELAVDISSQRSKHVDELKDVEFDYVVTVCDNAHERCPVFPGTRLVHVGFNDPPKLAEQASSEVEALAHYREVRDEIRRFVQQLPQQLTGQNGQRGD